eukprot:gene19692-2215_t
MSESPPPAGDSGEAGGSPRIGTLTASKDLPWGSAAPRQSPVWASGGLAAEVEDLRAKNT